MVKYWITLLFILLGKSQLSSQTVDTSICDTLFFSHLLKQNLLPDARHWIDRCAEGDEGKRNQHLYRYFRQVNDYDSAYHILEHLASMDSNLFDPEKLLQLSLYNLDTQKAAYYHQQYQNRYPISKQAALEWHLKMLYHQPILANVDTISDPALFGQVSFYQMHYDVSNPAWLGLQSAIVPGLGKWNLGYKRQAILSFTLNVVLGALVHEAFLKDRSAFGKGSSLTMFSLFYIGNIWGTVALGKKHKYDIKNQIDANIKDYYYPLISDF